jgi:hypothetical protein
METLTTERPTDWREWRRLRAWDLYEQRWKQKDIATALGVTAGLLANGSPVVVTVAGKRSKPNHVPAASHA